MLLSVRLQTREAWRVVWLRKEFHIAWEHAGCDGIKRWLPKGLNRAKKKGTKILGWGVAARKERPGLGMTLKRPSGVMEEPWTREETQISVLPQAVFLSRCLTPISTCIKKKKKSFLPGHLFHLFLCSSCKCWYPEDSELHPSSLPSHSQWWPPGSYYFCMQETLQSESPAKIILHPHTQWTLHMHFNIIETPVLNLPFLHSLSYHHPVGPVSQIPYGHPWFTPCLKPPQ